MFERYTEKARRTIFFARYEASQFGSPYIETEHLLLGLLREDKALTSRFLRDASHLPSIRMQIENATTIREKIHTSVDLPLSNECKRILAYAAEEAEKLAHKHIDCEHLLLGILREEKSFAAHLLSERGLRLDKVRIELKNFVPGTTSVWTLTSALAELTDDLTQFAADRQLPPMIGRAAELERLTTVLGRSTKNSAVLVGERGVGRATIVDGLAQLIAEGSVPSFLTEKRIIEIDIAQMLTLLRDRSKPLLLKFRQGLVNPANIYFMEELYSRLSASFEDGIDVTELIKTPLLDGKIRCIASATPDEHRRAMEKHPWLENCFTVIEISPMSVEQTTEVLLSAKKRFEEFHSVTYTDDALKAAAALSDSLIKDRALPEKAVDLIDESAAFVKTHQTKLPDEILEERKKIKFVVRRMEDAIANHEFEKARFYSDEERKLRAGLSGLYEKHKIKEDVRPEVGRDAVVQVLSIWTGIPVARINEGASGS